MSHVDGHNEKQTRTGLARRRVLVVDPDRLTRWSIEEYLRDAAEVASADGVPAAHNLLDHDRFDAIIVADDLPQDGADEVEQHARSRNPSIAAVRTLTRPSDETEQAGSRAILLEKPFELACLARALGL